MKTGTFRKTVLAIVLGASVSAGARAGTIAVTDVEVKNGKARVVINDVLEINDIIIEKGQIKMPAYTSGSGKVIPQVALLTDQAKQEVETAIKKRVPSKEKIRQITYNITKMSPYNRKGSSLGAFASVTFNGAVEVECKVMRSKRKENDYWIAWPARPPDKSNNERRWQDQVKLINKKVKAIVEKDIIKSYKEKSSSVVMEESHDIEIKEGAVDAPLTVTAVSVSRESGSGDLVAMASVDLNYSIRIKDIKVFNRKGVTFLEFPVYVSDNGKQYDQMKLFSNRLRTEMRKAIETETPAEVKSNVIGFEITKFEEFWKQSSLKYFCAVAFNGELEVECKVLHPKGKAPFVGWPSSKENGEFVDKVFPINSKMKKVVEKALTDRYYKEKGRK